MGAFFHPPKVNSFTFGLNGASCLPFLDAGQAGRRGKGARKKVHGGAKLSRAAFFTVRRMVRARD